MQVTLFTFNAFSENTYILHDDSKECVIVDPGCWNKEENEALADFITSHALQPKRLLNTHCHLDHIFGNAFIAGKYKLSLEAHKLEETNLVGADLHAGVYGVRAPHSPMMEKYMDQDDIIEFGNTSLSVIFAPGHSPGHVVFYNDREGILIGGDVLFRESIGRADLPGGDYSTLIKSIKEKLFTLPDEVVVYPGHGPETTIGYEKKNNPFFQ